MAKASFTFEPNVQQTLSRHSERPLLVLIQPSQFSSSSTAQLDAAAVPPPSWRSRPWEKQKSTFHSGKIITTSESNVSHLHCAPTGVNGEGEQTVRHSRTRRVRATKCSEWVSCWRWTDCNVSSTESTVSSRMLSAQSDFHHCQISGHREPHITQPLCLSLPCLFGFWVVFFFTYTVYCLTGLSAPCHAAHTRLQFSPGDKYISLHSHWKAFAVNQSLSTCLVNSLLLQRKHIELKEFFDVYWYIDQVLVISFFFKYNIYILYWFGVSPSLSSSLALSLSKVFSVCPKSTCLVELKPVMNGSLLCELMDCLTRGLNCLPSCLHLKRKFKQEEGLQGPDSRRIDLLPRPYLQTLNMWLAAQVFFEFDLGRCLAQLTNTSCLCCWHKAALSTSVTSLKHAKAINEDFFSQFGLCTIPGKNKAVGVNQHSLSSAPG